MAGRPKARAQRAAEEAERAQALLATMNDASRNATLRASARQALAEINIGGMAAPRRPTDDRVLLAQWWRDQMAEIERTGSARRELLATDGKHPSATFARQAKAFGALGIPRDVVAVLLEMSEADLGLYYGNEYAVGSAEVVSQVSANLLRIATSTNDRVAVKAAVEVMNRRGGEEWRAPAQKLEVTDDRSGKGNLIDSSKMSWQDRQLMRGVLERALLRPVEGEMVGTGVVPLIEGGVEGEQ